MATHYIENEHNSNQYYFDGNTNATSQAQRSTQDSAYVSPVAVSTSVVSSEYTSHPAGVSGGRSQHQQIRSDRNVHVENDSYQLPQQHQSVAGFNKSAPQQQYQQPPPSSHQIKATVRTVSSQEQQQQQHGSSVQYQPQQQQISPQQQQISPQQQQISPQQQQISPQRQQQAHANYEQQSSPQSSQVSSQHQQYQHDPRQQVGQPLGNSGYYQVPSSVQHTRQELDQRTESPSRGRDQHVQGQQVPVRVITSNSQQQYESSGSHQQQQQSQQHVTSQPSKQPPQQHDDQLQQYYSQLTPEQYQQLLRQQQIQRQQQEEQKRQQLAQQQYYIQQEQERQRTEQQQQQRTEQQQQRTEQQQQQYQQSRSTQESQHYDEHQQRRVQVSSNQEQQHRQQGQDQHDAYHYRPQPVQTNISSTVNQDSYRQQQQQQQQQQQHHGQPGQSDAYYEQQRRVASQQSPSSSSTYQQDQYRSTVGVSGGQQYQQISPNQQQQQQQHVRTDSERQRQDEQDYYATQLARQQQQERERAAQSEAAQRAQQQQEREYAAQIEASQRQQATPRIQPQQYQEQQQQIIQAQQPAQPVGLRALRNKFTGPTSVPTYEAKTKIKTTRQYESSTHTSSSGGPGQASTHSTKTYSMTYSALPTSHEPPVNSAEYYQMLQQGNLSNTLPIVQQSAAPQHIQGSPPGFDALRGRFKSGSVSESINPIQEIRRQQQSNTGSSSLSSLRDQYMNRAKELGQTQEESFTQKIQTVSRSSVTTGQFTQHQNQTSNVSQISQQHEPQLQSQSIDDQAVSSDGAVAEGGSSSAASPFENDNNLNTIINK
ncbi:unnamed protein product [Rotaria sordida]|uniref:Uncharacterized protein n=1 Tax=Rotaria sordida TaxID=392033 RepID=A0A814HL41_9BILA|nr:unnamed protein product [Rotaria sordida]CAF3873610.1 unnamed protein product [Rotaria sordida]